MKVYHILKIIIQTSITCFCTDTDEAQKRMFNKYCFDASMFHNHDPACCISAHKMSFAPQFKPTTLMEPK